VLVILCGIKRRGAATVYKFNGISLGILILAYVFSAAICPLDFNHTNGHANEKKVPDFHCGIGFTSYVPAGDGSSALLDLNSHWKLFSLTVEPKLPILVYSIFKIPKPA
jgi:hypothetical protein